MAHSLLTLVSEINGIIDEVTKIADNPEATADQINARMMLLEAKMAEMREFPDADWQQARNDILGLSANLDGMQAALTKEYEKSRDELSQLSNRAKAEKLYAAYEQPKAETEPQDEGNK